jgi:chitin synthase
VQGNFFLVFHILTASLGTQDLLGQAGAVLGVIFEWLYLATLVTCFVLSLGNRPQGSNKLYMTMVYFWVGIMIYLTFAAIFVTVKSIQLQVAENSFKFSDLFSNQEFFTIIVSLGSTYVMWFVASLLFFDPWHMFTCVSTVDISMTSVSCSDIFLPVYSIYPAYTDLHQRT